MNEWVWFMSRWVWFILLLCSCQHSIYSVQLLFFCCPVTQVEGAFTQGLGLVSLEQCVYLEGNQRTQRGTTFTTGPGTYKIPSVSDVPAQFNVSLLDRTPNPKAIFSSKVRPHPLLPLCVDSIPLCVIEQALLFRIFLFYKCTLVFIIFHKHVQAVGEPPLFLAASVLFALRAAITAARAESGLSGYFRLDSPATCERIRMACQDKFTEQVRRYTAVVYACSCTCLALFRPGI